MIFVTGSEIAPERYRPGLEGMATAGLMIGSCDNDLNVVLSGGLGPASTVQSGSRPSRFFELILT